MNYEPVKKYPLPIRILENAIAIATMPVWLTVAFVVEAIRERKANLFGKEE